MSFQLSAPWHYLDSELHQTTCLRGSPGPHAASSTSLHLTFVLTQQTRWQMSATSSSSVLIAASESLSLAQLSSQPLGSLDLFSSDHLDPLPQPPNPVFIPGHGQAQGPLYPLSPSDPCTKQLSPALAPQSRNPVLIICSAFHHILLYTQWSSLPPTLDTPFFNHATAVGGGERREGEGGEKMGGEWR